MESNPNEYDAGTDQNQGVVGTMARNQQHGDTESDATQVPRLDPNLAADGTESDTAGDDVDPKTDTMGERTYVNDEGTE